MTNNNSKDKECEEITFEKAFLRLEALLDKMNSGEVSLDESLKLYEEADKLINLCGKRLTEAERKIQILVKSRNGELISDSDGNPKTEPFRVV
jgi:exodeoxyribonuclease VII small subunit